MKLQMMKCARRGLQWRSRLILVSAAMLFCVLLTPAQDNKVPPVGGPGGGEFVALCPPGKLLGGVELRTGDDVDAIRPVCRTPTAEVRKTLLSPYLDGPTDSPKYSY